MKQRDLRGAAARLCALRQDRRTLFVVVITSTVALAALARGHAGFATIPVARKHPFRAATVATQGPDEHTAALNDSCFGHHGFQVSALNNVLASLVVPRCIFSCAIICRLQLQALLLKICGHFASGHSQTAACRLRWSS